jgi:hypothetical protein
MMLVATPEADMNLLEWFDYYGDGLGAMAGIAAAIVAIVALVSAAFDTRARSQPMVTAELRPAVNNDQAAELVLTNLGSTPARDVTIRFEPELDLPADSDQRFAQFIVRRYSSPIPVLNPGQAMSNIWWSGKDIGAEMLVNREPLPDDITVHVSYRGRGYRRLKDSFPLTMDSLKLTTVSVSSSSMKGRVKSIDGSLKKLAEKTSTIASVLNRRTEPSEPFNPSEILRSTGFAGPAGPASTAQGDVGFISAIRRFLSRLL